MAMSVLIHIIGDEAMLAEIDEYPKMTDTLIVVQNPRRRDGKDLPFVQPDVTTVIWPVHNIGFIEILPTEIDDEIISFVRE